MDKKNMVMIQGLVFLVVPTLIITYPVTLLLERICNYPIVWWILALTFAFVYVFFVMHYIFPRLLRYWEKKGYIKLDEND